MEQTKGLSPVKVKPRVVEKGDRKIEAIKLLEVLPYLDVTNEFNRAKFLILPTNDPAPGFDISFGGQVVFVPMTAILAIKYTKE